MITPLHRGSRRRVLRSGAVLLGLPWTTGRCAVETDDSASPPRMLIISNNLGVLPRHFFPSTAGADYELTDYLSHLSEYREKLSVFSGMSHPDVDGGHSTENCFLTSARGPTRSGFRNTISLDQLAAERLGPVTRFQTLNLGVNVDRAHRSLSWTRNGVLLPVEDSPARLFRTMFLQGTKQETQQQIRRLQDRQSILDVLLTDMQKVSRHAGKHDRERLDQYLTAVRDLEQRMHSQREWEGRPRPAITSAEPQDVAEPARVFERLQLMLEMAILALQSDSTRIITLMVDAFATPRFQLAEEQQTTVDYHNLSHHGQDEVKLAQLRDADHRQMKLLAQLFAGLDQVREQSGGLLDSTMVLFGSNMGDSNTHVNTNLPVLLAGGGLQHGKHHVFSAEKNRPLCDLFVSMLRRMGVTTESFGSSVGNLDELLPG